MITGEFYDSSFEKIPNALVSINTTPPSQQVFYSNYSLTLKPGSYTIAATTFSGNQRLQADETITVPPSGESDTIQRDLIFFPDLTKDLSLVNETIPESSTLDAAYTEFSYDPLNIIFVVVWVIVVFVIFRAFTSIKKKEKQLQNNETLKEATLHNELESLRKTISSQQTKTLRPETQEIYTFIRSEGQVTQKELRKQFPMSAAKLSLILTELEHMDLIRKVKKGRGNVILCKE